MITKISLKLSEFMFISNLSDWHYSCRRSFNSVWRNYPQPLTAKEQQLLVKLKKIFINYLHRFNEHPAIEFIGQKPFSRSKIEAILGRLDCSTIHQAMEVFLPRFNYHYKKQKNNMNLVRKTIDILLKENQNMIDKTAIFYNFKGNNQYNIFLSLSYKANKSAGGMYLSDKNHGFIILEFGDYDLSDDHYPLANILYHELGHHFQESSYWKNLITKFYNQISLSPIDSLWGVTKYDIMNEIIHASLWGEYGILTQQALKHTGNKIITSKENLDNNYYDRINLCAYYLRPYMEKTLHDAKPCPKQLLITAINLWKKF